jgi:hypothetical protein
LTYFNLRAAYPGDDSTSYFVEVHASWMDKVSFSYSIEHLTDILFETTDEETRRSVFAIKILENTDEEFSQKNALVTIEI